MRTKNCIRCLKPAHLTSGHVLREGKKVSAGFCSNRCHFELDREVRPTVGCFGEWKEKYGLRR